MTSQLYSDILKHIIEQSKSYRVRNEWIDIRMVKPNDENFKALVGLQTIKYRDNCVNSYTLKNINLFKLIAFTVHVLHVSADDLPYIPSRCTDGSHRRFY